MKLDSKLFDRIRVQSRRSTPEVQPEVSVCAWDGCDQPGLHKAPKGHRTPGEYHNFCLEHVRHYNTSFNFFADMDEAERNRQLNQTFEAAGRPSWGFGVHAENYRGPHIPKRPGAGQRTADPLHIWARYRRANTGGPRAEREIQLSEPDRRALETLGFKAHAKPDEIKKAYKALVKIHHPDANGGDKTSEERLRAIIAAYTHLKGRGFLG